MAKQRQVYRCSGCGTSHVKWVGQCGGCSEWSTLVEETDGRGGDQAAVGWSNGAAQQMANVARSADAVQPTGVVELDRALGGGLVPGSVTLLAGEPGIGKSTLLLQLAAAAHARGTTVLYVSGEESAAQLRRRADRLDLGIDEVWVQAETDLEAVRREVSRLGPKLLLVDSIQTLSIAGLGSVPGSPTQVRESAQALLEIAKQAAISTVLVGHVTKEGSLAGPRTLEHLVDTVLSFEGDRHQRLRFLRASKHRFGATGEPGVMEMTAAGLVAVPDPSGVFLSDRQPGASGSAVVPVVDGHRPLLVELQALIVPTKAMSPRRAAQGLDTNRLAVLLAVLERRYGLKISDADAYASVAGGVRVTEPGADLGVALAVASSVTDRALPPDLVVCGEVGLAGELRQVGQLDRRLDEAARLGYRSAIVPASASAVSDKITVLSAADLGQAMALSGITARSAAA